MTEKVHIKDVRSSAHSYFYCEGAPGVYRSGSSSSANSSSRRSRARVRRSSAGAPTSAFCSTLIS